MGSTSHLLLFQLLVSYCLAFLPGPLPLEAYDLFFNWTAVTPTKHLEYHPCYGFLECARLEVPLDWSNLSNPNTVSIALTRLPAKVAPSHPSFGGSILVNPGGPGGSGIDIMLLSALSVQGAVDSDKFFEIVSWDPRGVKFTTPSSACYVDPVMRLYNALLELGAGSLEQGQHALNMKWAMDLGLAELCSTESPYGRYPDGTGMHQYVSTALVARDMVEIIDKIDEHRKHQTDKATSDRAGRHQVPMQSATDSGPALLNYWGLSYGTYLGNTFASMFPERIGRMILDGVVDADDYAVTGWTANLQDNMKAWGLFFQYCFDAGPRCALHALDSKSPRDMEAQVNAFLADLKDNPIPVLWYGSPAVITYLQIKSTIHACLYSPKQMWPLLAGILLTLMEHDTAAALAMLTSPLAPAGEFAPAAPPTSVGVTPTDNPFLPLFSGGLSQSEPGSSGTYTFGYPWFVEAAVSVLCGDGSPPAASANKTAFLAYLALLESQSPLAGSVWAELPLRCTHWDDTLRPAPHNRFRGPFASNRSAYDARAAPLLFIGNTADPVTPVRNAHRMSAAHEGSVVLTQDVPGHCAGTMNPSGCIVAAVREFFARGKLPEKGLVCPGNGKPWDYL